MAMEKIGTVLIKEEVNETSSDSQLEEHSNLFLKEEQEAKKKFITWMLEDLQKKDRNTPFSEEDKSLTDILKDYREHWISFLKEEENAKNKFISWVQEETKIKSSRIALLESDIKIANNKNKKLQEENDLLIKKIPLVPLAVPKKNKSVTPEKKRVLEDVVPNSTKRPRIEDNKRKQKSNSKSNPKALPFQDTNIKTNALETVPTEDTIDRKDNNIFLRILTENVFYGYQGFDLYNSKTIVDSKNFQEVKVNKAESLKEVKAKLGNELKFDPSKMRLWPMARRANQSLRPYAIDSENNQERQIIELLSDTTIPLDVENADGFSCWTMFLEDVSPKNHMSRFTRFNMDTDVVVFLKYYDPVGNRMYFMGHLIISFQSKVSEMIGELIIRAKNRRLGMNELAMDNLLLYEEVAPNIVKEIETSEWQESLENISEEIMDGDIIIFQKKPKDNCRFPTVQEYFTDYYIKEQIKLNKLASIASP